MKKITSLFLTLAVLIGSVGFAAIGASAASDSAVFDIDTSNVTDSSIGKLTGYMNLWGYESLRNVEQDGETDISFVDYIELMTATGGSSDRDLIDENGNLIESKLNALAEACSGILSLGAKPLIKLGNIPFYFTMKQNPTKQVGTVFNFNVFPPDDDMYDEYEQYIENVLQYLINRFGLDEVRKWRFGVMTEYENADWFYVLDSSGNPNVELTMSAYFKIYDNSVEALENTLGKENVYIGAHSMTVTEGLWDERRFIDHVADTGVQLDYLSVSFYDTKPGTYTSGKTLGECFSYLRDYAESKGLYNLDYGVDEGRVYGGVNVGSESEQLNTRTVGHMWQAAYDARMYKTMLDSDADYFSVWSWTSDTAIGKGYPTIAYHVASVMNKMVGGNRINVTKGSTSLSSGVEAEAVASYDAQKNTLGIMAYNYKNDVSYADYISCKFNISAPQFAGKSVMIKCYSIDDNCNYFDEWWADRSTYGITDDKFAWSPDDPALDSSVTLRDSAARETYYNLLRDKYVEASRLVPTYSVVTVDSSGNIELDHSNLRGNGVVYYELCEADELSIALAEAKELNENDYDNFTEVKALIEKIESATDLTDEEKAAYVQRLKEETALLMKKSSRTGTGVSTNISNTSYEYATLNATLKMSKADIASSMTNSTTNDEGSAIYALTGNDTYDLNGYHMWCRTYQNDQAPSAHYYVDRYLYDNLSELGGIVSAEFSTWGRNHHHSIGIGNSSAKAINGGDTSITINSDRGNAYTLSLGNFTAGSSISAGSMTEYVYTPEAQTLTSSNTASIIGSVPATGESVSFRIGARVSAIDGYGWQNSFKYYLWTDVTVTGYDTTSLRAEITNRIKDSSLYTDRSYSNYENELLKAVNTVNTSYSQAEIDEALSSLRLAKENLVAVSDILFGDPNLDGKIDGMDSVIINCVISGMLSSENMKAVCYEACDVDRDGEITTKDSEITDKYGLAYSL